MERRIFDNEGTGPRARGAFLRTLLAPGAILATVVFLGACDDDTGMNPQNEEVMFEVRVENVSAGFDFTSTGVFNTPAGSDGPGPLLPGNSYEFGFSGGPGSAVSFATMFVQSNDLFYAPGGEGISLFDQAGAADRGEGLEALAEDGDPGSLASAVAARAGVMESGVFNTPAGAAGPAPAFPGEAYVFTVTAMPGDRLSLATMFVQSNDLFYAPAEAGVALFDSTGNPGSGDITGMVLLWDAGTEVNEVPGIGPNQAPRQAGADTGSTENGTVRQVNDGYGYPDVSEVIRITLTPVG